ncbi:carbamate kinase [Jannaschia faecimaris]|uniref:Carbamate kinase n=1 Tax=Jannaschia faecimaris TaxID=1244108 RepID=A0A1H3SS85_9RHOB|nr:carbamate kinase [Jannaschia faecimaris]SDZ40401.1 carbamate kinase [Jannaschia faecimaris]
MLVVAALGGNALLQRGQAMTPEAQSGNVGRAAEALARIVRAGHDLVITHGNGPQIGMLAMQSDLWPLDILGAETDGMIGYVIERELENALDHDRPVATLLTQVLVDAADPAFKNPTKFVGPVWTRAEAEARALPKGWKIAKDGNGWRRVVASPTPIEIPDMRALRLLLQSGAVIICGGGGGIPVVRGPDGRLSGVEAVVDKDRTTSLLARRLEAGALLLLTDVRSVMADFGTSHARGIPHMTPDEAGHMDLPAGSMAPKVDAAADFARRTGRSAYIGRLEDAAEMLEGNAGTRIGLGHPR